MVLCRCSLHNRHHLVNNRWANNMRNREMAAAFFSAMVKEADKVAALYQYTEHDQEEIQASFNAAVELLAKTDIEQP